MRWCAGEGAGRTVDPAARAAVQSVGAETAGDLERDPAAETFPETMTASSSTAT